MDTPSRKTALARAARARVATTCFAATLVLAGCSFTNDALWPSLAGNDPKASAPEAAAPAAPAALASAAPAAQAAPVRVEIPPSPAERAAQAAPAARPMQAASGNTGASTTVVGQRVTRMREDVQRLQDSVAAHNRALQQMRGDTVETSQRYYTLVGGINARLQVGTTPGNPILHGQWGQASQELDRISTEIGRMTTLSSDVAADAALAAFLLESVRAAYSLSGAIEEDHRQLAMLQDDVNRTVVSIDRMLSELSEDINRQSAYVSRERSNMSALATAIKNGELYGTGLGNRALIASAAPGAAGAEPAVTPAPRGAVTAQPASADRRPLVVIRFDRPNPSYEQALYTAVSRALERRPQAQFDLVAVASTKGNQAQAALASTNSKKQAETVFRSLTDMGLPADRVKMSARTSGNLQSNEIHLYVR